MCSLLVSSFTDVHFGSAPSWERDAKAQARLAAELLRLDEVLDQDASIRFDDAL